MYQPPHPQAPPRPRASRLTPPSPACSTRWARSNVGIPGGGLALELDSHRAARQQEHDIRAARLHGELIFQDNEPAAMLGSDRVAAPSASCNKAVDCSHA